MTSLFVEEGISPIQRGKEFGLISGTKDFPLSIIFVEYLGMMISIAI